MGNFLFPCQFPRAARVQSNLHDSASGRQLMVGIELKIWRDEANQRALVEKPGRGGPSAACEFSSTNSEKRSGPIRTWSAINRSKKRKADSIDDLLDVNALSFNFSKLICSCCHAGTATSQSFSRVVGAQCEPRCF